MMVELGLYAVARLHAVIFQAAIHPHSLRVVLLTFATATVCLGGVACYAEHHLKRLLAFSTVCHAGMMLAMLAIGGPVGIAAFFLYLLAHAVVKSSLFFCAGLVLQRLRSISEQLLWQRRRVLRWTGVVWLLGGLGLAGLPPFGTWAAVSLAESLHEHGITLLFLLGETLTAAAVLRVGMHVFAGWGTAPLTDPAAHVDELPETDDKHRKIKAFRFMMPVLCLALACGGFAPRIMAWVKEAAGRFADQNGYWHAAATGQTVFGRVQVSADGEGAAIHAAVAFLLAVLLALTSVYRRRLPKWLRIGPAMEGQLPWLRGFQSGHPGDYVLWITVGCAFLAMLSFTLLRAPR